MEHEKKKSQERPTALPEEFEGDASAKDLEANRKRWIANLRLLWNQRNFLIRVASVGLVFSAIAAFVIPNRYTASTRLMPPDSQSSSSMIMLAGMAEKVGAGPGSLAGDLLGLKSSGALFVGMLQSQTIEDHLVKQFDLKKIYRTQLLEAARGQLSENTSIQEDRKSGIITITITDHDPQRATAIANAYVNELNSMVSQLSTSSAHRERVFLEERLQSVKRDLDDAEAQFAQFSSKNNTLDIQQQGKAMLDAAATLSGQMIAAESELQGLRQIYTENNARVRELSARVGELRKELDRLGGTDGTLAQSRDSNGSESKVGASDSSPDMPYPSIRKLPLLGAKYADYYRQAKIQETVFELLTEQNELAKVEEAKETPSVKILDPAEIPERKAYPPRLTIMLMGTFIAITLATILIIATARWREIDPQDQGKILVQEIVGTVRGQLEWVPEGAARFSAVTRKGSWFRPRSSRGTEQPENLARSHRLAG